MTADIFEEIARLRRERRPAALATIVSTKGSTPAKVPARMLVYFAACENPFEYTGRLFWAEREMAEMGIELDGELDAAH